MVFTNKLWYNYSFGGLLTGLTVLSHQTAFRENDTAHATCDNYDSECFNKSGKGKRKGNISGYQIS